MSYVVQIWEQPEGQPGPSSIEEAIELLDRLQDTEPGQNPKFILLAQRLAARYPESAGIPEYEWAWTDGPPDGKTEEAVYGLGINSGMLDEVRSFVIQQAQVLGLNVMDDQAGEAYLADGRVLSVQWPKASQTAAKENYDDVPKAHDLANIVFERLKPFLKPHGYKARKSNHSFKTKFPNGWHEIVIYLQNRWPLACDLRLTVNSRFHEVTNLIDTINMVKRSPGDNDRFSTTILAQQRWMDDSTGLLKGLNKEYVVQSYSEIDVILEHMTVNMETRLLPTLEKYKTIEGLDELLNPMPVTDSMFFGGFTLGSKHIIAAYLAHNPNLEALCDEFEAKIANEKAYPDNAKRVQLCIDYVRQQLVAESRQKTHE